MAIARRTGLAAGLVVALAASSARAQDPPPPAPPPVIELPPPPPAKPGEELMRFTSPKDGWTLLALLEAVNVDTKRSVLYDSTIEKKMGGVKVQFVGTYVVPKARLFDWLQGVLSFSNYILIPICPLGHEQWMVVDSNNQAIPSRPTFVPAEDLEKWRDRDGVYIVSTLRTKNLDANDAGRARQAIQGLATRTGSLGKIAEIPGQNAFVIADFAPVVYASMRLLEAMDVPLEANNPVLEQVAVEYAVASEIAGIVTDLLATSTQPGAPRPQPGAPGAKSKPEPQIISDDRTNSILLFAVPEDIGRIKDLISQLDTPYKGKSKIRFRTLRYQLAEDVADLLDELISGTSSSTSRSSSSRTNRTSTRNTRPSTPTPNNPGAQPFGSSGDGQPVIIPDPKNNSLIVHATDDQWKDLTDVIDELDRPRKQVLIETALVELTVGDTLDFGLEGFSVSRNVAIDTNGDGIVDSFTDQRSIFGISSFGGATVVSENVNGIDIPIGTTPNISRGITAGIFDNGRVPLILSALQSRTPAKIVTMPAIVTSDNQPATIKTTDTVPYLVTTFVGPNQTPQQTFESVDAETNLTISPSISADDFLRLNIKQIVSSFRSAPSGQRPPTTSREIETELMVPNAHTVVLGGIISTQETQSREGIPLLMDIPLLGFLFQKSSSTLTKTNLFLFVTPRILKDLKDFTDYKAVSWEKKALQDELFGEEVKILGSRFDPAAGSAPASDAVRKMEDAGRLDAYRFKAESTEADRRDAALRQWEELQRAKAASGSPAGAPPATPPDAEKK